MEARVSIPSGIGVYPGVERFLHGADLYSQVRYFGFGYDYSERKKYGGIALPTISTAPFVAYWLAGGNDPFWSSILGLGDERIVLSNGRFGIYAENRVNYYIGRSWSYTAGAGGCYGDQHMICVGAEWRYKNGVSLNASYSIGE